MRSIYELAKTNIHRACAADVAAILGHCTLEMVKRYTHLSVEHTVKVAERMDREML